jgi:hypothetical protein
LHLDDENATIQVGDVITTIPRADVGANWPGEYLALLRLPETVTPVRVDGLPAWANDADPRIGSMKPSMRPPSRSWNAGAVPLYGTTVYWMPPARLSSSVARWPAEPIEPTAKVVLSPLALA